MKLYSFFNERGEFLGHYHSVLEAREDNPDVGTIFMGAEVK